MQTVTDRLGITFDCFDFRVWYLRRTLAKALGREQKHREAVEHYRGVVMPDLERRLQVAEMAAAARVAFRGM